MRADEIQMEYARRSLELERSWMDLHTPPGIREVYQMTELISLRSFERYIAQFGHSQIDPELAREGKSFMSWGTRLSEFERDCIEALNKEIERRERRTVEISPQNVRAVS